MTKINDYLWHLPHQPLDDDPPDVSLLQQAFNMPVVAALEEPLGLLGYQVKGNDVMVKLDERVDGTVDTYYANVRFIAYLEPDVIIRVHFEHVEWAHFLAGHERHRYFINLDRFKVKDPRTQIAIPAWPGRLHTRMSCLPRKLHHDGEDQIWSFSSAEEFEAHLQLFLDNFQRMGHPWLSESSSL
jgi:hypothetical protein